MVRRARRPWTGAPGRDGGDRGPGKLPELLVQGGHVGFDGHYVVRPAGEDHLRRVSLRVHCIIVKTAPPRRRTPSAALGPRGSRCTSRPRRPGRGPRRSRAPGPRPGAGPSRPCSTRRGRSCRRSRSPPPQARTARVHSQAPRPVQHIGADQGERATVGRLLRRAASAPSTASTSGPASPAHCPIAANDLDPAMTAAIPTASSRPAHPGGFASSAGPGPGQGDREDAGSGQPPWAKMSSAGGVLVAGDGEREELPSFRRARPQLRPARRSPTKTSPPSSQ